MTDEGRLRFGTAGIRGPMRPEPGGINRETVARTAAGLATFLRDRESTTTGPEVLLGFDARHFSADFASEAAAILAGAGHTVRLLTRPTPTPLLAFGVRALDAGAGVMITASHNPGSDNGLKVYLGGPDDAAARGAQIVPPADSDIEEAISRVGNTRTLPRGRAVHRDAPALLDEYLSAVIRLPVSARDIRVAFTPLHGVGGEPTQRAFQEAGFPDLVTVAEQAEPDPDFPTTPYPNPEEPGVLDRLGNLLRETGRDLGLAVDPDADRCAAVVPHHGGLRVLTGDEIGLLLADAILRTGPGPVATTIVSSSALAALATKAGVPCHRTLTGFKWLMRADADLVFAYEEALGYAVAPRTVRDKDGISAALLLAASAAELKNTGRTLVDRLDELASEIGLHLTSQVSVRFGSSDELAIRMQRLREDLPDRVAERRVLRRTDYRTSPTGLPPTDAIQLDLAGDARIVLRPSGTEPKLKAYLQQVVPGEQADAGRHELARVAAAARQLVTQAPHASN